MFKSRIDRVISKSPSKVIRSYHYHIIQNATEHKRIILNKNCHLSVPPSKPYFDVDMATPWVAGKRYAVTCVALDAKPEAEITFYKGKLPFWRMHLRTFRHGHPKRSKPKPQSYFKFCDLHRSQPQYINIKQSRRRRSNVEEEFSKDGLSQSLWLANLKRAHSVGGISQSI